MERQQERLVNLLKEASYYPEGLPLARVGKNPGLLTGKSGSAHDTFQEALQSGYLTLRQAEGRADWVQLSARGETFLREQQDPRQAVAELLEQLQTAEKQMPRWLAEVDAQLAAFRLRSQSFLEQQGAQLSGLIKRAESALRRLGAPSPRLENRPLEAWQMEVLTELERLPKERSNLTLADCFQRLQGTGFDELTIPDFHAGIALLCDRGTIRLVPIEGAPETLEEPEYALAHDGRIYFALQLA